MREWKATLEDRVARLKEKLVLVAMLDDAVVEIRCSSSSTQAGTRTVLTSLALITLVGRETGISSHVG